MQSFCTISSFRLSAPGISRRKWEHTQNGISKNQNVLKGRKRRGLANLGTERATLRCTLVCNFSPSEKNTSSSVHFSQYCNKNKNKKIAQHPVLRFDPKKKSNENEERERESHHLWNTTGHPKHGTWPTPITCSTTTTRRHKIQRKRETKMRSERKKLAQKSPKSSQKQRTQVFTFEQPVHEKLRDKKKPKWRNPRERERDKQAQERC